MWIGRHLDSGGVEKGEEQKRVSKITSSVSNKVIPEWNRSGTDFKAPELGISLFFKSIQIKDVWKRKKNIFLPVST